MKKRVMAVPKRKRKRAKRRGWKRHGIMCEYKISRQIQGRWARIQREVYKMEAARVAVSLKPGTRKNVKVPSPQFGGHRNGRFVAAQTAVRVRPPLLEDGADRPPSTALQGAADGSVPVDGGEGKPGCGYGQYQDRSLVFGVPPPDEDFEFSIEFQPHPIVTMQIDDQPSSPPRASSPPGAPDSPDGGGGGLGAAAAAAALAAAGEGRTTTLLLAKTLAVQGRGVYAVSVHARRRADRLTPPALVLGAHCLRTGRESEALELRSQDWAHLKYGPLDGLPLDARADLVRRLARGLALRRGPAGLLHLQFGNKHTGDLKMVNKQDYFETAPEHTAGGDGDGGSGGNRTNRPRAPIRRRASLRASLVRMSLEGKISSHEAEVAALGVELEEQLAKARSGTDKEAKGLVGRGKWRGVAAKLATVAKAVSSFHLAAYGSSPGTAPETFASGAAQVGRASAMAAALRLMNAAGEEAEEGLEGGLSHEDLTRRMLEEAGPGSVRRSRLRGLLANVPPEERTPAEVSFILQELEETEFFLRRLGGLTGSGRRRLAKAAQLCSLGPYEFVFRQGEPADGYYVLLSGEVDVLMVSAETGATRRVHHLGSGEGFGERALGRADDGGGGGGGGGHGAGSPADRAAGGRRTASVMTTAASELLFVDAGTYAVVLGAGFAREAGRKADLLGPVLRGRVGDEALGGGAPGGGGGGRSPPAGGGGAAGLGAAEQGRLCGAARFRHFRPGAVVCKEGDRRAHLRIIRSGEVRVLKRVAVPVPGAGAGRRALRRLDEESAPAAGAAAAAASPPPPASSGPGGRLGVATPRAAAALAAAAPAAGGARLRHPSGGLTAMGPSGRRLSLVSQGTERTMDSWDTETLGGQSQRSQAGGRRRQRREMEEKGFLEFEHILHARDFFEIGVRPRVYERKNDVKAGYFGVYGLSFVALTNVEVLEIPLDDLYREGHVKVFRELTALTAKKYGHFYRRSGELNELFDGLEGWEAARRAIVAGLVPRREKERGAGGYSRPYRPPGPDGGGGGGGAPRPATAGSARAAVRPRSASSARAAGGRWRSRSATPRSRTAGAAGGGSPSPAAPRPFFSSSPGGGRGGGAAAAAAATARRAPLPVEPRSAAVGAGPRRPYTSPSPPPAAAPGGRASWSGRPAHLRERSAPPAHRAETGPRRHSLANGAPSQSSTPPPSASKAPPSSLGGGGPRRRRAQSAADRHELLWRRRRAAARSSPAAAPPGRPSLRGSRGSAPATPGGAPAALTPPLGGSARGEALRRLLRPRAASAAPTLSNSLANRQHFGNLRLASAVCKRPATAAPSSNQVDDDEGHGRKHDSCNANLKPIGGEEEHARPSEDGAEYKIYKKDLHSFLDSRPAKTGVEATELACIVQPVSNFKHNDNSRTGVVNNQLDNQLTAPTTTSKTRGKCAPALYSRSGKQHLSLNV